MAAKLTPTQRRRAAERRMTRAQARTNKRVREGEAAARRSASKHKGVASQSRREIAPYKKKVYKRMDTPAVKRKKKLSR